MLNEPYVPTSSTVRLASVLRAGGILAGTLGVMGCDATIARPPVCPPPGSATLADVDETTVDGADEPDQWLPKTTCPARLQTIEYVKMSDWTPPPSVRKLEAAVPPRGDVPPSYIKLPRLTKYTSIGGSHFRRH